MEKSKDAAESSEGGGCHSATSENSSVKQAEGSSGPPSAGKKGKYRKEKPWDTDDIDHWKIEKFLPVGIL